MLGNGRLSLERERDQHYDLIAEDACSGDSIPVHLPTAGSLELFFRHLRPDGILALHITNTYLGLPPVVEALGRTLGKHAVMITTERDKVREVSAATRSLFSLQPPMSLAIAASQKLPNRPELRPRTDDYNNLFQILRYYGDHTLLLCCSASRAGCVYMPGPQSVCHQLLSSHINFDASLPRKHI